MKIWEAILQIMEPFSPGKEFGLMDEGFKIRDEYGELKNAGLVDLVRQLVGKRLSDGTITRRMREFNKRMYDCSGVIFRWEVVRKGWYRITEHKGSLYAPIPSAPEPFTESPDMKVVSPRFEPVEQDGELCLF